ncbi:hypothetical protein [Alteromonas phage P24]|nr:hypothetical protein [Alteromonas phage P24]
MKALTPQEYADEVWGGAVTSRTVRNWINAGKKLKGVSRVETTPTGRMAIFMEEETQSNVQSLVDMMKARQKAA